MEHLGFSKLFSGNSLHSDWKWPSRNSWFTHQWHGGSFHSYVNVYQRVGILILRFVRIKVTLTGVFPNHSIPCHTLPMHPRAIFGVQGCTANLLRSTLGTILQKGFMLWLYSEQSRTMVTIHNPPGFRWVFSRWKIRISRSRAATAPRSLRWMGNRPCWNWPSVGPSSTMTPSSFSPWVAPGSQSELFCSTAEILFNGYNGWI